MGVAVDQRSRENKLRAETIRRLPTARHGRDHFRGARFFAPSRRPDNAAMVRLPASEPSAPHNRHDGFVAEMKTIESKRQRLGVPQTLDFIQRSLRLPSSDESPDKPGALLEVRTLVQAIIDQTRAGDGQCGYFLAELAVFLWKFRER